jgi:ferritin-like protein
LAIDRAQFLRMGAVSLGAGLLAAPAGVASAQAAPQGDDVGYLFFGATGELVSAEFYSRARKARSVSGDLQRRLAAVRTAKRRQFNAFNVILGENDAVLPDDFRVVFPEGTFASTRSIGRIGARIEAMLVGVYLSAARDVLDPGTRLVLGQALAFDAQQRAWMRELRGANENPTRMPRPLTLEEAGPTLDEFLAIPGVEPE